MARSERNDVDYFPHNVNHGKKMFFIEKKYKNDGYAVWFKLLEELGKSQYHYLDISEEVTIMFLSSSFNVSEEMLIDIIKDLVKLGEFDEELFKNNILFNQKYVDSIEDAYKKRNNDIITRDKLLHILRSKGRSIEAKSRSNGLKGNLEVYGNTQSKEEDIKEDKTILKEIKGNVPPVANLHKHFDLAKSEYIEIYSLNFSAPPTFGKFCNKDLNSICYRVQENMINRGISVTADTFQQTIKGIFVLALADKWLKSNYTPSNIEKRIDQIINNAKKQYEQHNYIPSWDRD